MQQMSSKQQKQQWAALVCVALFTVPVPARAQCRPTARDAAGDSSLTRPLTTAPDSLGGRADGRHTTVSYGTVARSRRDPKVARYRDARREPRLRVTKDGPCAELVAPGVAVTPYGSFGRTIAGPSIPAPPRFVAPNDSRLGLFGGLWIGAIAAAILGRGDDGGTGSGPGVIPPGVIPPGTVPPGVTPPGTVPPEVVPPGGATPPGGETTPPGGAPADTTTAPPDGGEDAPPNGGGEGTTPPGGTGTPGPTAPGGGPGTPAPTPGEPGAPLPPGTPETPGASTPETPMPETPTAGTPATPTAVPEPSTIVLVGGGLLALAGIRRSARSAGRRRR